jgi:hypothetical protein
MNTSLIKSALAMTAAFAVGSALATETVTQLYGATFEDAANGVTNDYAYTAGDLVSLYSGANLSKWFAGSADDQSTITDVDAKTGDQALKLQTEGGTLTNQFFDTLFDDINSARENAKVRFEANVKFVASDTLECGVEAGGDAKFALYAYAPDGGTTNLVVVHYDDTTGTATNEVTGVEIDTEKYTSILVEYRTNTSTDESYFSVTVDGEPVTSDLADDDIWFMTINDGDHLDISSLCFKGTGMVDDLAISKVEEAQQQSGWVDDSTAVSNQTAAAAYPALASSALANANAGELTDWAKANSVEFSAVTAAPADYVDAFLLNCAATPAAVAQEKAEFVLDITIDENGVPVITLPEGKTYNGTIQLKGATTLTGGWTNISEPSAAYNFYKCELHL